MQLMIDIATETAAALRLAAAFLVDHAALKEAGDSELRDATPPPPSVPAGTSSVLPFPSAPPAPPAPPAIPNASTTAAPVAPTVPAVASLAPSAPASPTTPDELDSAGVPWDARIHQKGKSKKKDHTWKLQKGIAEATVAAVMQELSAQGRIRAPGEGVPAAPSFPGVAPAVPVPPIPALGSSAVPAPGVPGALPVQQVATDGGVPQPSVTFPGTAQPAVPVPPAPAVGVPNAPQPGVVQVGFRELVTKITAARAANRVTAEEVSALVAQAGAPNLQTLGAMAHLVPVVDQLLDVLLATR